MQSTEEIFRYQIRRNVTNLFKSFLILLEDVKRTHDKQFDKLKSSLPNEAYMIELAEYLYEDDMDELRKKVLDGGNDCIRLLEEAGKNCGIYKE